MKDVSFELTEDEAQLFDKKIALGVGDECNLWTACTNGKGYGLFRLRGKTRYAHRIAWQRENGREIRTGLEINHLCRTRECVKASHLQECTHRENVLHGNSFASENLTRTHCPRGHELTEENCRRAQWAQGGRSCLTCNREQSAAISEAHKLLGMTRDDYVAVFGWSRSVALDIVNTFGEGN